MRSAKLLFVTSALLAQAASAQPPIVSSNGLVPRATVTFNNGEGKAVDVSADNPLPVTGGGGGGGGSSGCTPSASAPTRTAGSPAALNCDLNGALRVAISSNYLGARLQDATGAAFGTSGNPIFVSGGGGGGGGAVTIANGADTAQGTTTDAAWSGSGAGTMIALLKAIAAGANDTSASDVRLVTGTSSIGSISNSAFGISGTLPAFAATPTFNLGTAPALQVRFQDGSGAAFGTAGNPIYVSSGSGGGGSADSTAANQASQITIETAIRDRIGATTSPAAGTTNKLIADLTTALGYPLQGGGSVAIYAALPTGTNTIGSIGNTYFGARLQDGTGAAFGTSGNPIYVTGGGGGGAVTVANGADVAQGTTTDAAWGGSGAGTMIALLKAIAVGASDTSASDVHLVAGTATFGSIANTSFGISGTLPAFASTPTVNVGTIAAAGTPGSTAPATALEVGGVGPSGNLRALATGTNGGLLPGQAAASSSRVTLTASTITTLSASNSGTLAIEVQLETSPTADVFLCFNASLSSTCSATAYDRLVASGTAKGAIYQPPFGSTGAVYAYSTGTPVIVTTRWAAQ